MEEAGEKRGVRLLLKTETNMTTLFFKDAKPLLNTHFISQFSTSRVKVPVLSPAEESEDPKQRGERSKEAQKGPWEEATLHSCPGTSLRPLKELLWHEGCPRPHRAEFP